MTSLTLVIPCKDEAKRLMMDAFLDALRDYPYLSFLFVDDGSTDDTAEVLALLERQSPAIHALYLPKNVGKAEAVRTGVNWLLDNTEAEVVGFWDADLATPFSELPAFVRALRGEAAIGSRSRSGAMSRGRSSASVIPSGRSTTSPASPVFDIISPCTF